MPVLGMQSGDVVGVIVDAYTIVDSEPDHVSHPGVEQTIPRPKYHHIGLWELHQATSRYLVGLSVQFLRPGQLSGWQ